MVREDLIAGAVNFLQDPSVASASLEKRIEFLKSKNLTQEEIDISLARSRDPPQAPNSAPATSSPSRYPHQSVPPPRQPLGYGYGYEPYQVGPWGPQPPPPPPRRDWRDWFIMATVTSGVGYGLYTAAQRYIVPLIAPPTPPQLEQDKAAIDESFNKAFSLIDQLASDTAAIKAAEAERTEKVDTALKDVNTVVEDLKAASNRREAESRIVADQVAGLKELVPKSLEAWKANGDARLDDLAQEMQSLKRLLENRVGRPNSTGGDSTSTGGGGYLPPSMRNLKPKEEGSSAASANSASSSTAEGSSGTLGTEKGDASSPRRGNPGADRKAAIPAWQMAASSKGNDSNATEAGA